MGSYSIEEITLDAETGKKIGRKKIMGDQYQLVKEREAKMPDDDDEEEEKGDSKTKIREKYQLA